MKYPLAGDLQAKTVSTVVANPRRNSKPASSELDRWVVQTSAGYHVYWAVDERDARAQHRDAEPGLSIISVFQAGPYPITNPRGNASGRYELHTSDGLEAIFADRDVADFEASELRRRGVDGVEIKVRPPARHPTLHQKQNPTQMTRDQAWLAFRRTIREPGVASMAVAEDIVLEYRLSLVQLSEQGKGRGIFVVSPAEVGAKLDQIEWEVEPVHSAFAYRTSLGKPSGYGIGFRFIWHDQDAVLSVPNAMGRYLRTQDAAEHAAAADAWAMAKQMKRLQVDETEGVTYNAGDVHTYLMGVLARTFKDKTAPAVYEVRGRKDTGEPPKKKRTYLQARDDIWAALARDGWAMSSPSLKLPHATSPNGLLRLWFKPQAVHYTINSANFAPGTRHVATDARAIAYDLDIRTLTPSEFLDRLAQRFPKAFA